MKLKSLIIAGSAIAAGAVLVYQYRRTIPKGVNDVKDFDIDKFLGQWYEIARMDFLFEKNLNYANAEYSLNDDGSIKVVNRGYNYKKLKEVEAKGRAVFVGNQNEGKLKVSFFGPFYSGYNVIAIDNEYKYALICGRNRGYLWLLSKEKEMPEKVVEKYLQLADNLGFDTSKLVWTSYK